MSYPTPNEMLDWIALFVTEINTLEAKRGVKLEICASDDDDSIVVTRCGPHLRYALDQCVIAGMKQLPRKTLNPQPSTKD